jgi:predicted nucleic acid-binding protein
MRFFFLDGSALAKRYVAEAGSPLLDHLFDQVTADRLVVLNFGFAEVVSILVRRKNAGSLSAATFSQALL